MITPEKKEENKEENQLLANLVIEVMETKDFTRKSFCRKVEEIYNLLESSCNNLRELDIFRENYDIWDSEYVAELCLEIFPNHVEILQYYVKYLWEHKAFRRAIPYMQKFLELIPDSCDTWNFLGFAINEIEEGDSKNDFENPEYCFKKAIELDDSHQDAWLNLAKFYKRNERYEDAIPCLEKLLELNEEDDFALFLLGHVHQKMGNGDLAIEFYEKSLDIDSTHEIVWNNLGTVHASRFEFHKAIQMYVRALSFDDENDTTWLNLKCAYLGAEQFEKADYCKEKAQKLSQYKDPQIRLQPQPRSLKDYETAKREGKWYYS